jgi:CheY-like chemotaxis protein
MTILVVDDDHEDIEIFLEAIKEVNESIKTVTSFTAMDALDLLKNIATPSHIFLDINMPVITGIEMLERLRTEPKYSDVPVTVLSTSSRHEYAHLCQQLKADYITKPNSFAALVSILSLQLSREKA